MATRSLILVLGDQLSRHLASLRSSDPARDRILMVEVWDEATYVAHHKKKIAFLFSAMRHFAAELVADGWRVDYVTLDDPANAGGFSKEIARAVARHRPDRVCVVEPGEWRVRAAMTSWQDTLQIPVKILDDDRFIASRQMFSAWAGARSQLRMEYFYREMRRKTGLLMDGSGHDALPVGGKWNFDADNRKPAEPSLFMPRPLRFSPDHITLEVLDLVGARFADHFGDLTPFWFAVTAADAQQAFDAFVAHALPFFGDHQDAMLQGEAFLYHAAVSHYLNAGLLSPLAMCRQVERAYYDGAAPLNAVEGFIRQVIGWREYVRGLYWLKMPDYAEGNFLDARRPLPEFYWTADTGMACVAAAVRQTREEAYAHHIQRLMVTGNFALLAGIDPKEVHEWYLAVYADAYEWVELPNTIGMSQFADGGVLGSKPYAASGNYINKMSDYCKSCHYDVKQKTGETACPFNALYWDFLDRNKAKLGGNARLARAYATWNRMSDDTRTAYRLSAKAFLDRLDGE